MDLHWQDEHEDRVRIWLTQAFYNRMMHAHSAVWYTRLYHVGGLASVGLSTVTAGSISLMLFDLVGGTVWGQVLIFLLALSSTVVSAAIHFLNPQQLAQDHNKAEILYNSFIEDVNTVIVHRRCNREPCAIFMERAKTKLQLLPLACPTIPTHISRLYVKKSTRKRPTLDDIVIGDDSMQTAMNQQQVDIEDALVAEANHTHNTALHRFLAEKSNILDQQDSS